MKAQKIRDSFRAVPAASSLDAPIIPLSKIMAIKNCQKVAKSVILAGKEFTTTAISELDHVKIKCPDGN